MPFLRVIRDRRGYETTYLMHWYREGHRQRSRILYVFRTPGGVRVGRDPLDPEMVRLIEAQNPDIAFDWQAVRENQQVVEPVPDARRRRVKRDDAGDRASSSSTHPPAAAGPAAPTEPPPTPPARATLPAAIQGATPAEQMAFLAEWYPIVREWIPRRTSDPARREALLALAERLDPTAWTDADQITTGLQLAAEALERLSYVFTRRRRRSRGRSTDARPPDSSDSMPPES